MNRAVTERDFRMPEFMNADPADYEFRADGKIVRKDRWESAIHSIHSIVGPEGREFEIPDVVEAVRNLATVDALHAIEHARDVFESEPKAIECLDYIKEVIAAATTNTKEGGK
jgi:hypothetical protein